MFKRTSAAEKAASAAEKVEASRGKIQRAIQSEQGKLQQLIHDRVAADRALIEAGGSLLG